MFTGIIEEIGKVKAIAKESQGIVLTVSAKKILEDIKVGDSVCTNGICLTVVAFDGGSYTADVMPETMLRTNFKDLKINDKVNLERALPANGRLGGHIVSGHIDGTGTITRLYRDGNAVRIRFSASSEILEGIVPKGSIAIDGISLTVTDVTGSDFGVSVVGHTQEETTLTSKKVGDTVNLENDIVGKYIKRFVQGESHESKGLSLDFLTSNGF